MVKYIFRLISLLITIIITFFSSLGESADYLQKDITEQQKRIAELEAAYNSGEITPVNEASFFNGNLAAELDAGMKFNEIAFIATHNSYQKKSVPTMRKLYAQLSELTFGLIKSNTGDFESQTLTQQFNCGIRSIEMDIETILKDDGIIFTCMHNPTFDMGTTCYDLELALKEISLWSDNNPKHLPITVIIEPKQIFMPIENMKFFNTDYVAKLDLLLRKNLGEKLFTPADMLRDYKNFGEMRAADDWCKVKDMLGKVLILLHDTGVTEDYIALDPSIKSQAMFPMLRENDAERDCASFLLINEPKALDTCKAEMLDNRNFIVRTRADKFNSINEEHRKIAIYSGAQIISTDYPPKYNLEHDAQTLTFENRKTVHKVK